MDTSDSIRGPRWGAAARAAAPDLLARRPHTQEDARVGGRRVNTESQLAVTGREREEAGEVQVGSADRRWRGGGIDGGNRHFLSSSSFFFFFLSFSFEFKPDSADFRP